jgi:hypothetical protein
MHSTTLKSLGHPKTEHGQCLSNANATNKQWLKDQYVSASFVVYRWFGLTGDNAPPFNALLVLVFEDDPLSSLEQVKTQIKNRPLSREYPHAYWN